MPQKGVVDLVLEIVRGQQVQLDRLSREVDGGEQPGLKEISIKNGERIEALKVQIGTSTTELGAHEERLNENERVHRDLLNRVRAIEGKEAESKKASEKRVDWVVELVRAVVAALFIIYVQKFWL